MNYVVDIMPMGVLASYGKCVCTIVQVCYNEFAIVIYRVPFIIQLFNGVLKVQVYFVPEIWRRDLKDQGARILACLQFICYQYSVIIGSYLLNNNRLLR